VRGSGANLPEGVVNAIEGLWDMSRTPTCAGARFQHPYFQGIERSTCPSRALYDQVDYPGLPVSRPQPQGIGYQSGGRSSAS